MFLLIAFVFGFGMASTILIGQASGRRDAGAVRRIAGTAVGGFLPAAAAIAVLGVVFARPLLEALDTTAAYGVQPLVILFVAMYPIRLGFALGAREWLGVDAIWWSFPVAMVAIMLMAIGTYLHGGWRSKGVALPVPTAHECAEKARADQHPGMATAPA